MNFLNNQQHLNESKKNLIASDPHNNCSNKDDNNKIEEYVLNNLNKFNKEILSHAFNNNNINNMYKAVEVFDLNHFQDILLNAEKAIYPDYHKKSQKDSNNNVKENIINTNNITNFSSIPIDENPNQNINFNNMKDTNNMDFINILIQLKRGQRNDDEKNNKLKSTITKIDDDSHSYIKEILDICSDENKNNYNFDNNNNFNNFKRNAGKLSAVAGKCNQSDMNTINLHNFEIINSSQQVLQRHDKENFDNCISNNDALNSNYSNNSPLTQIDNSNANNNQYLYQNNYNNNSNFNYPNSNKQHTNKADEKTDSYFNYIGENYSDSQLDHIKNQNPTPAFNGKSSESSHRNLTNNNNQTNYRKLSNNKLETNDLIEITNRRKNFVNNISSVDGYFRRRHLETLVKMEKIKKEKNNQEEKENNHIPKINKKSKEIANRICGGSVHNIIINPNNKVQISKGNNNSKDNIEVYYESNNNNDIRNNVYNKSNKNRENNSNSQPGRNLTYNKKDVNVNNNNSIMRQIGIKLIIIA